MKPYEELTPAGQLRRLRRLAEGAIEAWATGPARLRSLHHWENATFRVDAEPTEAPARFVPGRYLLRVHSPDYNTPAQIASELRWLEALAAETDLPVPLPVRTRRGETFVRAEAPGVPETRTCTLLRWFCVSRGRTHAALRDAARRLVPEVCERIDRSC